MSSTAARPPLLQELHDRNEVPLVLGPIAGYTDQPMRAVLASLTPWVHMYEPFISSRASHWGDDRTARQVAAIATPETGPVHAQIFGDEPEILAESAAKLEAEGAESVDINMGCPVKKIAQQGQAGSFFLREPELARSVIRAVVRAVRIPVSIKTRLGWSSPESDEGLTLCRIAEEEGCAFVTVHGRSRAMLYGGECHLMGIARIVNELFIPVIGNGDVTDARSMMRMVGSTGVNGVMIARATIGRPWVFGDIRAEIAGKEPEPPDVKALMIAHFEASLKFYGGLRGIRMYRKHLAKYLKGIPGAASMRDRLVRLEDAEEIRTLMQGLDFSSRG